jgi:hypothetical protein
MTIPKIGCKPYLAVLLIIGCLCSITAGCATHKNEQLAYSGFLEDYRQLQADPHINGVRSWITPYAPIGLYNRFMVEPVVLYFSPELQNQSILSPLLAGQLTDYMTDALRRALGAKYKLVDKPGHDVARIQAAFAGAMLTREALDATPEETWALSLEGIDQPSGSENRIAVAQLESRLLESLTGKHLAKIIIHQGRDAQKIQVDRLSIEALYPVINYWAELFRQQIDQAHGGTKSVTQKSEQSAP